MTDDRFPGSPPGQNNQTPSSGNGGIALDDMGIPILDEIVAAEAEAEPEQNLQTKSSSDALKRALTVPHNEILANALRNQLRSKVKKNLDDITQEVAAKTVADITPDLERMIRDRLTKILDQSMEEMIEKVITETTKRI